MEVFLQFFNFAGLIHGYGKHIMTVICKSCVEIAPSSPCICTPGITDLPQTIARKYIYVYELM